MLVHRRRRFRSGYGPVYVVQYIKNGNISGKPRYGSLWDEFGPALKQIEVDADCNAVDPRWEEVAR